MKKIITIILITVLCFSICACGKSGADNGGSSEDNALVNVTITNMVEDRVVSLMAKYGVDDEVSESDAVQIMAGEGCLAVGDILEFPVYSGGKINENNINELEVSIVVTDNNGATFEADDFDLPAKVGDTFNLELRFENGEYDVWQIMEDGSQVKLD